MRVVRPIPGLSLGDGWYVRCGTRGPGFRNSGFKGVVEDPRPWIRNTAIGLMILGFVFAVVGARQP